MEARIEEGWGDGRNGDGGKIEEAGGFGCLTKGQMCIEARPRIVRLEFLF